MKEDEKLAIDEKKLIDEEQPGETRRGLEEEVGGRESAI